MAITTEYLEQMAIALEAMNPKFHASTDNLGKYLGDGVPREGKIHLRTVPLAEAIRELIEYRKGEPNGR